MSDATFAKNRCEMQKLALLGCKLMPFYSDAYYQPEYLSNSSTLHPLQNSHSKIGFGHISMRQPEDTKHILCVPIRNSMGTRRHDWYFPIFRR